MWAELAEAVGRAEVLWQALRLGLSPNPLLGIAAATLAATLGGHPRVRREQRIWAWTVLAAGWLIGDGMRVIGRLRDTLAGSGPLASSPVWLAAAALAVWAFAGFAVGYLAPAAAGWAVGRRVTHGTGWLAAGSVAVGVSLALATVLARIA